MLDSKTMPPGGQKGYTMQGRVVTISMFDLRILLAKNIEMSMIITIIDIIKKKQNREKKIYLRFMS